MVYYVSTPKQINLVAHPVAPIIREIYQQEKDDPIVPGCLEVEECELLKKDGVNPDPQKGQEQTRQLGRYAAADVSDCVRKTIKVLIRKSLYK